MTTVQPECPDQSDHPDDLHYRWLPTMALEPGMVVARPVVGRSGVLEIMYVAAGFTVNANTIEQMVIKGVECIAVVDASVQQTTDRNAAVAQFEARLAEIFGSHPNPACQTLMDALRIARPVLC
jgi:hypothetical protein